MVKERLKSNEFFLTDNLFNTKTSTPTRNFTITGSQIYVYLYESTDRLTAEITQVNICSCKEEFTQECYERYRPKGRLVHNKQFAPYCGSVPIENAPNLHAGPCVTKRGRRGGSGALCFTASHFGFSRVSPD